MIKIKDYPQLKLIAWNFHVNKITEYEALDLYELNWRFDESTLTINERILSMGTCEVFNERRSV